MNTIGESNLKEKFPKVEIKKAKVFLKPYGKGPSIKPKGKVNLLCERKQKYHCLEFVVIPDEIMGDKPALLSGTDCEKLGIVKIEADEVFAVEKQKDETDKHEVEGNENDENTNDHVVTPEPCQPNKKTKESKPNNVTRFPLRRLPVQSRVVAPKHKPLPTNRPLTKDDILKRYDANFRGIGKMGPPVKFKCKENVTPIQMPIHRVPISKRLKEKLALKKLEEAGFIVREKNPTDWVSNILCRESPNKFRVCIDPSQTINKAIERPIFQMPTLKDQLHELKKAKVFSVIDVKDGFFHVPLDYESSLMTTMHTSYGRYRWLVLPNGINSAPEEFQMRLLQVLDGLSGIIVIADDILVFGSGDTIEEAERDHDRNIIALMDRAEEKNLKFNIRKFQFKQEQVK